jgi:hypothetical protein
MARKSSSKGRRREAQATSPAASEATAVLEAASESPVRISSVPPELLAAHDNFVRSPAAVLESLGLRVTPSVIAQLRRSRTH